MDAPPPGNDLSIRLIIAANLALAAAHLALWIDLARKDAFFQADFTFFYAAVRTVASGNGDRLYDREFQGAMQVEAMGGRAYEDGVLPNNYPPWLPLAFSSLGWLSRPRAFIAWTIFQLAALAYLALWLWRRHRPAGKEAGWLAVSSLLAFPPVFASFQLGTFPMAVTALLALFLALWMRGSHARAGIALAVAAIKPQMILAPGLFLLASRSRRGIAAAVGVLAGLVVASGLSLGWGCFAGFAEALRFSSRQLGRYGIDPSRMYNLKGAIVRLTEAIRPDLLNAEAFVPWLNALTWGGVLAMGVLVLRIWRRPVLPSDPSFGPRFALTLILGLIFSPHLNGPDLSVLIVAARLAAPAFSTRTAVWACAIAPWLYWGDLIWTDDLGLPMRPVFVALIVAAIALTRACGGPPPRSAPTDS